LTFAGDFNIHTKLTAVKVPHFVHL